MCLIGTNELLTSMLPGNLSALAVLLTVGVVCLVAAVIGGGLTAFGFKIPVLKSVKRQCVLGLLGMVLVALAHNSSAVTSATPEQGTSAPDHPTEAHNETKQTGQTMRFNQNRSQPTDTAVMKPMEFSVPRNLTKSAGLPAAEAQLAIRHALDRDDISTALSLLSNLSQGSAKAEECDHVFEYALKNTRLAEVESMVDRCWEGAAKEQKIEQINHEYQKTAMTGENQ